jgi:hypothetical protein
MHLENSVRLRRRLGSLILDIHPYTQDREITLPLLDLFLQNLHAMIELANDEIAKQLKQMIAELRAVQDALEHPEDQFYALTKKIVARMGDLLRLHTSELEDLENDRSMKSDTEPTEEFDEKTHRVQGLIKNVREDLKAVQTMIPPTVPPTDACDAFYLLDQKIAQQTQELLAECSSRMQEIEQAQNVIPDTAERFFTLAKALVQRIDGILEEVGPSVEEIKQTRGIVAGTDTEETFSLLAQKIGNRASVILDQITPRLEEVKVTEVVGRQVVHFNTTVHPTILIGRVERFKRASRIERGRLVGDTVIRLSDEQEEMKRLFYDLYFLPKRTTRSSGLSVWPADLPQQTFGQTKARGEQIELQWILPLDILLQKDVWEKAANLPLDETIVQTITQAGADARIGRRVHDVKEHLWGYLGSIEVHADGSETWKVTSDGGQIIIDESSQFWLMAGE